MSKALLLLLIFLKLVITTSAQSTAGITNKPDSSYNNHSAFISSVKSNPETKMVEPAVLPAVAEKKDITYCSRTYNRALKLDMFFPKKNNKQKRVAVIIVHGGGWRTGNRTQHHEMARRLADRGYVCFTPEYRLSTEALYPAAVHDVKAAIRFVRAKAKTFSIDTGKIVVVGFSAGGELAAFMGATNGLTRFEDQECEPEISSKVNAVIDIDGTLSFVHAESGEGDDSKRTSAATYWFGYPKKDNPTLWEEASPLTHTGPHTPPTLFLNSSVDRMHAGREDYIRILKSWETYTEVKTFIGAPHSFCLFHPWFEPTIETMDAFMNKVFK